MRKYFKDNVRNQTEPDFCVRKFNDKNILKFPGKPRCPGAPADHELLVNVFDLGGLMDIYIQAAGPNQASNHPEWQSIFEGIDEHDKKPEEWLNEKLGFDPKAIPGPLVATEDQKTFVKAVLQVLNVNRAGWPGGLPNPYQPSWVVRWTDFLEATKWSPGQPGDARSWLEVTGIPRETGGRWLILLVYPVSAVRVLARPTILDADWTGYHFPSPPCATMEVGGHPMDLGTNYSIGRPISEFIHTQIDLDPTYWENSGYAIGRTTGKVGVDLPGEHVAHRSRLEQCYENARANGLDDQPLLNYFIVLDNGTEDS